MQKTLTYFPILLMFVWGCSIGRPPGTLPAGSVVTGGNVPISIRHDLHHQVARMETLWRISKMYGVPMENIVQANRLKDPASIKVGQRLLIPQAAEARSIIPVYDTRRWDYIVVHHSATDDGNALTIDQMHYRRGFDHGLGYHFLIDNGTLGKGAGQIEVGPRWIKQMDGAHANAAGMNEHGIGICLIGNFSKSRVSESQLNSLVFLTSTLMKHYRIPPDRVIGHRDVPGKNTECPGNYFPWEEFKRRLRAAQ